LAVTVADQPEIFPLNYVVDHGTLVFRTAEGTKLAALMVSPRVAFEADGRIPGDTDEAWSVVVKGSIEELRRLDEVVAADDLPLFPWHESPKGRFVRVVPHQVTGRRFPVARPEAWDTLLTGRRRSPRE
jgi:nitroimidazol reductase NimA-like FMN-containing flavoprotein (pyridoxamine 5'-phosphate oxidase superfamily)